MIKKILLLGWLSVFVHSSVTGQQTALNPLQLSSRKVVQAETLSTLPQHIRQRGSENKLVYLHTTHPLNSSNESVQIQDVLNGNWYMVNVSSELTLAQLQNLGVDSWAEVLVSDKISDFLKIGSDEEDQKLVISVLKGTDRTKLEELLASHEATLTTDQPWKSRDLWQINTKAGSLARLAESSVIRFINPAFEPQTLNGDAVGFTNTQAAHQPIAIGGHGLTGAGVTIGVGDNSDPHHVDFSDRIRSFNPNFRGTHGFHTTGTVGGNGIKDERYKGFAPKSNLISDYFSQVIANGSTYRQDFDMVVSSNSYGNVLGSCSYAGTYDVYSQYTDQLMRDEPDLLNVFAAANDGMMTCTPFPLGYATVTSGFSTAKNVLTVANLGKSRDIINLYTSRGPVKDGRLKPEITAMGQDLWSTIDNDNYEWNTGTSMACPNVAGAAVLLYQRYRQLNAGQNPSSALIKLLLMNGADDLDIPGPGFRYGFGLMNTGHSLRMMDSLRYFSGVSNTLQEQNYTIAVPPNTAQLRVMLYWNDEAAAPLASTTLVNDLDLSVSTPSSSTVLPFVLDPSPSGVTNAATTGADHLNNVEQVVINNPSGTYTVKVKGSNVPQINQEYFLAYDFIPQGLTMQYPFGGEAISADDSTFVYWEASAGTQNFSLSYSLNNGTTWVSIDNNIAADRRSYVWFPPATASTQCLLRISRNSTTEQAQTTAFRLMSRPQAVLSPLAEQCPGGVKISWNAVPGASAYRLYKKVGADMQAVEDVTATTYNFTGLPVDSQAWVAVAPLLNGLPGMRSVAVSRVPNSGSCTGIATHGDLALKAIPEPLDGRRFTSSVLSSNESLKVLIGNNDDQPAANYSVAYQINGGAWLSHAYTDIINPGGSRLITVDNNLDLATIGSYSIRVAVTNNALTDPESVNDTLAVVVRQVDNPAIDISSEFNEQFETSNFQPSIGRKLFGFGNEERWDFVNSGTNGRLRSFVNSGITLEGNRSLSMDNAINQYNDIGGSSYNTCTGTFNLENYANSTWEIRAEFDYVMHGVPKFDTGNAVWVRGSDTEPWLPLLSYQIDTNNLGALHHSGSLSITDALSAGGQNFSAATQIMFTQYDTSLIAASFYGNGFTFDNFKLYAVTDDVQMLAIDSVYHYNCGLSNAVPLRTRIRNGVNNTVYNVTVSYQLNNGPVISEIIDSIAGKDTVWHVFAQTMDLSTPTSYSISTWVNLATDTYRLNDSITDYPVKNQPVISSYPYIQDFEQDEGFFYTDGNQTSWAYGTPASARINRAASGTKAWKTNLTGSYNSMEYSYLYSPCFNIIGLAIPTLSFQLATDIESPGSSVYDIAYVEYTHDGRNWQKLGQYGSGTNWYSNDSAQAWTKEGETWWHVATILLPNDGDVISFRFVLRSDQGAEYEGVAVDDIHIYDLQTPIFSGERFAQPVVQQVSPGTESNFVNDNRIAVSLISSSSLGSTAVQSYGHSQFINEDSTQYYVPRNFTIQTESVPGDSVEVKFYVPDAALQVIREDAVCYSCSKPWSVLDLGITKYSDADKSRENDLYSDNTAGTYQFISPAAINWLPYDIGYIASVKVKSFSEFWFNDGGPTGDQIFTANLFDFTAAHQGRRNALLQWSSFIDAQTTLYELQRADESMNFQPVTQINAVGQNGQIYSYVDAPVLTGENVYYRVRYELSDGSSHFSLIRSLNWADAGGVVNVYPNPIQNGEVTIEWFKGNDLPLNWGIFDIMGRRINYGKIEEQPYNGKSVLSVKGLAIQSGIYILKIESGKEKWEFKLVSQ